MAADWTHARTLADANASVLHFRPARAQTLIHTGSHTHQRKASASLQMNENNMLTSFFFGPFVGFVTPHAVCSYLILRDNGTLRVKEAVEMPRL